MAGARAATPTPYPWPLWQRLKSRITLIMAATLPQPTPGRRFTATCHASLCRYLFLQIPVSLLLPSPPSPALIDVLQGTPPHVVPWRGPPCRCNPSFSLDVMTGYDERCLKSPCHGPPCRESLAPLAQLHIIRYLGVILVICELLVLAENRIVLSPKELVVLLKNMNCLSPGYVVVLRCMIVMISFL